MKGQCTEGKVENQLWSSKVPRHQQQWKLATIPGLKRGPRHVRPEGDVVLVRATDKGAVYVSPPSSHPRFLLVPLIG